MGLLARHECDENMISSAAGTDTARTCSGTAMTRRIPLHCAPAAARRTRTPAILYGRPRRVRGRGDRTAEALGFQASD